MSLDWWPSIHGLRSVNPVWGHHVCNGRDLHGSAGLGPEKGRGQAERAIAVPPGAAPDRLGTSGQIWEGNVDGGAWEGPAAREQPCSRAASQNSLLTANLQTREKPGCRTDFSLWPPAIALHRSHDFSLPVFLGRAFETSIWVGAVETGITYFFTTALCTLARSQEQWMWEHTE